MGLQCSNIVLIPSYQYKTSWTGFIYVNHHHRIHLSYLFKIVTCDCTVSTEGTISLIKKPSCSLNMKNKAFFASITLTAKIGAILQKHYNKWKKIKNKNNCILPYSIETLILQKSDYCHQHCIILLPISLPTSNGICILPWKEWAL